MTTASIIFCVAFTAVMAPMLRLIWKQIRRDRYLDSVVDAKRLWYAGKGEWPEGGFEATEEMALQLGDWGEYNRAVERTKAHKEQLNG